MCSMRFANKAPHPSRRESGPSQEAVSILPADSSEPRQSESPGPGPLRPRTSHVVESIAAAATLRVTRLPGPGTLLEIHGDQQGRLDGAGLETVAGYLQEIAKDMAGGDVAIDLSNVLSMTARFLNILDYFRRRLRYVGRRLVLCGVNAQCTGLFRLGGLDELVDCCETPHVACREKRPKPTLWADDTQSLAKGDIS